MHFLLPFQISSASEYPTKIAQQLQEQNARPSWLHHHNTVVYLRPHKITANRLQDVYCSVKDVGLLANNSNYGCMGRTNKSNWTMHRPIIACGYLSAVHFGAHTCCLVWTSFLFNVGMVKKLCWFYLWRVSGLTFVL